MSEHAETIVSRHTVGQQNYKAYVWGLGLSIILTVAAYLLVAKQYLEGKWLVAAIISLAITQFVVQVIFFLHLGQDDRPRWKQLVFTFMIAVVLILVLGTIWIMANLDYHHAMSPSEMDQEIIKDEGIKR